MTETFPASKGTEEAELIPAASVGIIPLVSM